MKKRIGGLVAATAALTMLSVVSSGSGNLPAGASSRPTALGTDNLVALAMKSGVATLIGTTTLGTGTTMFGGGPAALPSSVPAGDWPRNPNIAADSSAVAKVPASLSTSQGKGRPSNIPYPTVAASPVMGATNGLVSTPGLNGFTQGITHPQPTTGGLPGIDVEPSDQGLCASPTNTVELNNVVIKVFKGGGLNPVTTAPLESLFGTPEIFGGTDGSFSVQGDPRCFYDSSTSRWYASQLWLDLNNATPQGWAGTWLAVSTTSDPTGKWNVYFVPDLSNQNLIAGCNNDAATNPTANPCFGDQPLLGVDGSSVQISTNEYSIFGNAPNGQDNYYFLSKSRLDSGAKSVPVWWNAIGATVSSPGAAPWYSVAPAQSPDGLYSVTNGGTSYALSSLDFSNAGDQRIAEWAFTNTSAVDTASGTIHIYEVTLASGQYGMPPLAAQKTGPTPLGDYWNVLNGAKSNNPVPQGPIATNDDRMSTAAFDPSTGALVGALNTGVNQITGGSTRPFAGVAYFEVTPTLGISGLETSPVSTGYISPLGADAYFPAAAIAPNGKGVIAYGMSGVGYYPSTAYSTVAAGDAVSSTVHIAALGVGPQDGFTEYQGHGTSSFRPRWGDYSAAQVVGNNVAFATEMINQQCTDAQFKADFTCGGTRDLFINWGTSVNLLTP